MPGGRLFAAEHELAQVRQLHAFLHRLGQHVVEKGRHADQHLRLDLADEPQIALRAHDLAAAGAEHEDAELRARIVRDPEGEVRREGEEIHHAHLALGPADAHHARAGELQVFDIVRAVEKRHRLGRAPGGAGHQQRPVLALEALRHRALARG